METVSVLSAQSNPIALALTSHKGKRAPYFKLPKERTGRQVQAWRKFKVNDPSSIDAPTRYNDRALN